MSELKTIGLDISDIEKEAQELDEYYISTRYPGQYGGPEGLYDEEDAKSAVDSALKILRFTRRKISGLI